jgi:hypothetical protein
LARRLSDAGDANLDLDQRRQTPAAYRSLAISSTPQPQSFQGADIMKSGPELPQSPFPAPNLPLVANGQKLALAAARLQAQAFKAAMRYQIEALNFFKHRVEQDVKFVDDLGESNEFNDAFDVFATFMQNAATEYATEVSKVISIGSKLASDTARRVRKEAEEVAEDISVAATA